MRKIALFHLIFSAITSTRLSGLEKTYSKFARDIFIIKDKKRGKEILTIVNERLKTKLHDISYADFEKKFIDIKFSNKVTKDKRLIQLIFSIIEDEILKNTQELQTNLISLEHIHSQQRDTSWSHNIGNIIPLSKELNEECKDYTLKAKIPILKKSELKQVEIFCEKFKNINEWTEELTNERAKELANTIFEYVNNTLNN